MRAQSGGFTLVEVVVALTLLAAMLALLFAGLRSSARAWDAGSARGDRADQISLASSFLRRELSLAFPWRFKDPVNVRLAFEGEGRVVRFVSNRPSELSGGGLSFVSFEFDPGSGQGAGRLVMRRAPATWEATDFTSLDASEPFVLIEGIDSLKWGFYGAEGDLQAPSWQDSWRYPQRLPSHVRLEARLSSVTFPELVVALSLGEEAGCLESGFQRACVPRR